MKERFTLIFLIVLALILISILLVQCNNINEPPDVSIVQQQLKYYRNDIQTVISFMLASEYDEIYIDDTSKTMFADFSNVQIRDENVCSAIEQLLKGRNYFHISKRGDTVSLRQWIGLRDIACGIIYANNTNSIDEIVNVVRATELIPLSEAGWFYYVSDYNAWRNGKRASLG